MALSRYTSTTSLMGTRLGNNHENAGSLMNKPGFGKPTLSNMTSSRVALGNISNRNGGNTRQVLGAKKDASQTMKPTLAKKHVITTKPIVDKENTTALKPTTEKSDEKQIKDLKLEKQCASPAPMDFSSNSQGDAFSKQLLNNVTDIDKDDSDNPQLVSEYVNNIYDYMRDLERKYQVKQNYLEGSEINGRMRGILIDWLVQVHLRFHLLQETLYLTVDLIDRFLQEQHVTRSKLQLVGVTTMLLASKYEEMYAPEIADFVYITDNAYSKADIRKMECTILKTLDFNLGKPLPLHFLRRNSKAGEVDANKHTLAKYLMELTIVEYDMVNLHPSEIAAAALCLAMKILDGSAWCDTLVFYSKYTEKELMPIMQKMAKLVLRAGAGKLTAIKVKYQSSKFMKISLIPELNSQLVHDLASAAE